MAPDAVLSEWRFAAAAKARTAAMLTTVYSMLSPHPKATIEGPARRIVQILSCAKKYTASRGRFDGLI